MPNSTKLTRIVIRDGPDTNIFATLYFLCCKVHRVRQVASDRAHVVHGFFCHPDLRQNTSVERECRTGRHVYEASIQIFKLTLLEKGST